jgi:hypothetical protein
VTPVARARAPGFHRTKKTNHVYKKCFIRLHMSQFTEEEKKRFENWLNGKAELYLLQKKEEQEQRPMLDVDAEVYEEDEEVRVRELWDLIQAEALMVSGAYLEIYGGGKFTAFMAQDYSDLDDLYPHLLLHAQMRLTKQKKDRESRQRREQKNREAQEQKNREAQEQKKRKRDIDGKSAAGGSAGVKTGAPAGGSDHDGPLGSVSLRECPPVEVLDDKIMIAALKRERSRLMKQVKDQAQVYTEAIRLGNIRKQNMNTEMWLARDKCERTESKNAELHNEISELKVEIAKLKGQNLNLPPDELRGLLGDVTESFRRISDAVHLEEVRTGLESRNEFCCPISSEVFTDAVAAPDGYVYERKNLEEWIRRQLHNNLETSREGQWKSPCTQEYFKTTVLPPATAFISLMSEKIDENLIKMRVKQVSR